MVNIIYNKRYRRGFNCGGGKGDMDKKITYLCDNIHDIDRKDLIKIARILYNNQENLVQCNDGLRIDLSKCDPQVIEQIYDILKLLVDQREKQCEQWMLGIS